MKLSGITPKFDPCHSGRKMRNDTPKKWLTKNEFLLEPMHQFQPNFNCYFLFYIEFTIENYLNFKGQKGQKRPEFWPWEPLRGCLKPYSINLIPEKSGNMLKLPRKGRCKRLGFDRLLAFFGLYGLWNKKIFFGINSKHRTRL